VALRSRCCWALLIAAAAAMRAAAPIELISHSSATPPARRGGAAAAAAAAPCVRMHTTIMLRAAGLLAYVVAGANAVEGPCDILQAAGQPCVAAHSTTRALYGAYDGGLYILQKPNMQRMTIGAVKAGGFADTAAHDQFCGPSKDCVFLSVLDQSPMGNHLTQRHKLVPASQHPVHVGNGVKVYGMYFDPGYGYHVDNTTGVAKNNEPESIFAVMSGTHYNGGCCL
jgi:hypothetical protein